MSKTVVTYPIVSVLVKSEDMEGMGPSRIWTPVNDTQTEFLEEFFAPCRDEVARIPEIESIASWTVEEVNAFLKKRGFNIQLQPIDTNTFAVASVLELLVTWLEEGDAITMRVADGHNYDGVRLGKNSVSFYETLNHKYPIAKVKTKSGDLVFMTILDDAPDNFALVNKAKKISRTMSSSSKYGGLIFPMVDLRQEVDISWLLDLKTTGVDGQPAWITQALQETILKMNEVGALAASAVAIGVTRCARSKPDMIINRPFLVWFERPGLNKPLFVGHITQKDWRNPGSLSL